MRAQNENDNIEHSMVTDVVDHKEKDYTHIVPKIPSTDLLFTNYSQLPY